MNYLVQNLLVPNKSLKVLDTTAHVGGFSLVYATCRKHDSVVSLEIDPKVAVLLKYNIKKLCIKNITPIYVDSIDYINNCKRDSFDFIYVDPPWGGPEYKTKKALMLYMSNMTIVDFIKLIFTKSITKNIFLKLPINFDFQSLLYTYTTYTIMSENVYKHFPDYLLIYISLIRRD